MNQQSDDPLFRQLARLAPRRSRRGAQRQCPRALSLSLGPSSASNASICLPMAVPLGVGRGSSLSQVPSPPSTCQQSFSRR